jgi:ketopantoate reductase
MIATLLARSGATVSVVARGRTAAALNRDGVRLIINSEMLRGSIQVSEDPSELGVQDYVVVAVKAPSLPDVARYIGPLLGPPPFSSDPHYDAKAWEQCAARRGLGRVLLWNVAGPAQP